MNIPAFRLQFPYFANPVQWPDDSITAANGMVGCYIDLAGSWYNCSKCVDLMESLMTAHLLYLNGSAMTPGQSNVGVVTSASIGSVSVGLSVDTATKGTYSAWLSKSPWGEQLLALLGRLSAGGRYIGGSPERRAFRKVGGLY